MPTVAVVEGVKLLFYANDHPPPHFHALFADSRAVIDIRTLKLVRGALPKAKARAVVKWASLRRDALYQCWEHTQAHGNPERIR